MRSLKLTLMLMLGASVILSAGNCYGQASIQLYGPPTGSYVAPADFDLQVDYQVSSGPKAEFIEDPYITQNGEVVSRMLKGPVPIRGLPPGTYQYMFRAMAVRILPDGDMSYRPMQSGPVTVTVTAPPVPIDAATPGATSYPNPSIVGRAGTVSLQMINTGETTWTPGNYFLDTLYDFDKGFWNFTPQPVTRSVPPGDSFTFEFAVTAREYNHLIEWRDLEYQLRRDSAWFGLKAHATVFVREAFDAAIFESQSVPSSMEAGKQYPVSITMRNSGENTWKSQDGYALGSQSPDDNLNWGVSRLHMTDTPPGASATFTTLITAPTAVGDYAFQWRMLREGVEWFGMLTPNTQITVTEPPPLELVGKAFVYDALGREVGTSSDSELGPLATATAYLPGNRIARANARGKLTTTTYQAFDTPGGELVLETEEPEGRVTRIDRDRFGAIRRISRGVGMGTIERSYVYDAHHRRCKSIEPESGTTAMGYDLAGRIVWMATGLDLPSLQSCDSDTAQASPRSVTRSYDANGRLAFVSSPDGNGTQTFHYAPDGMLLEASASNKNPTGTAITRMSYNSRRMLSSETSLLPGLPGWTVSYGYDMNGSLASQTLASGVELRFAPDALGRPRQIADQQGRVFASDIRRAASGAIIGFTYGNGVNHRMTPNLRQLPARISADAALDLAYAYDENANVTSIVDHIQGQSADRRMTYDPIDRLTSVQSNLPGVDQVFAYDQADNLVRIETSGQPTRHHHFDVHHRLTNIRDDSGATITGLAYDVAGNLSNRNGVAYSFDLQNRLRSVGSASIYSYDAEGRRVQLGPPADGRLNRYMYLTSGRISRSFDGSTGALTDNIHLGRDVIASIQTSTEGIESISFHHSDALGSRVATTQADGALLRRTSYSAYGSSDLAANDSIGYTGHIEDAATDMVYMQQRYYDPHCMCFLSTDPESAFGSEDWRAFNRYSYAFGNPYTFQDPDGRFGVAGIIIGAGIEVGFQLLADGKVTNWTAVGIAGATGAVTGGLGGVIGRAAAGTSVKVGQAVVASAAVGGAAGAVGKATESALGDDSIGSREVGVAAITGAFGGGVGGKIGLASVSKLERMAASNTLAGHMGRTTEAAVQQGGKIVGPSITAGQGISQAGTDAAASFAEKRINK